MKVLTGYNNIVNRINKILSYFLGLLLLIMTILITWQVFARFVVGSPLSFSEEIARFIMIWLTMLGSAVAFRKGTLISVDVLHEFGGPMIAKILSFIVPILGILFAYVLIVYGFELSNTIASQTAPSTRISMRWPMISMPISGIVIILNSISLMIDQVIGEEKVKL